MIYQVRDADAAYFFGCTPGRQGNSFCCIGDKPKAGSGRQLIILVDNRPEIGKRFNVFHGSVSTKISGKVFPVNRHQWFFSVFHVVGIYPYRLSMVQ